MLTRGERSMMVGPSQSGKSFVAIDMALSIARGVEYFGRKTLRGGVVYQAGEGGRGLKKRLRAYRDAHGVSGKLPFVLLPAALDLHASDDHTNALIAEIKHWASTFDCPLELVVIDTLAAATPGANENASEDMSRVLARCARIATACNCHVMIVHHMNADGVKPRGHTSIFANLDTVIAVEKTQASADGRPVRRCKLMKQKDGEDGQNYGFEAIEVDIDRSELGLENGSSLAIKHRETISGEMDKARKGQEKAVTPDVTDKGIFASYALKALFMAMTSKSRRVPAINDQLVVTREDWKDAVNELRRRNNQEALTKKQGDDGVRSYIEKLVARGIGGSYDTKEVIFVWLNQATMLKLQADPGFGGGEEHFPQKGV